MIYNNKFIFYIISRFWLYAQLKSLIIFLSYSPYSYKIKFYVFGEDMQSILTLLFLFLIHNCLIDLIHRNY